ncbi:hypothetical protein SASPL_121462 [Salvia splendens]|uniref:Uncharacterized protein n=1 Tax=Salvia splendens TaxID=180675 RepID=A0A8X8ZWK6_SALSN|nr:uncharacterized protein LOC121740908 [Salvia splendens]KAG6419246.1 hypothetical protein SASPL_121462 [Salvia splendens]
MKNSIRCCISCILPCGALDVIRIVHTNGHVEEISGAVTAAEIMKLHPKHVLKKPSSPSAADGMCPKIIVVPPDAQLQRGKIYFLMPLPPPPKKKSQASRSNGASNSTNSVTDLLVSDRYLSEILSEKVSSQRDRRRGRGRVWRPHLDSISEGGSDA